MLSAWLAIKMIPTKIAQNPNLFQVNSQSLSNKNFLIDLEIEIIGGLLIDRHAIGRIY